MSIEKNNNESADSRVTIKALSAIGDYTLSEKVVLTSSGYKPYYLSNSGFDFMMRCEIPQNANGYLMGIKASSNVSASNTFYIKVENNVITWVVGASSYTRAWEAGVHDIGWVGGRPVYDNQLVSQSATAVSAVHNQKMAICGVNEGDTYTFIASITLYRVDMYVYTATSPTASNVNYFARFYPSSKTLVNAMKYPEATLTCFNASGGAGTGTASGTPTYGVQLDDLRYITKSGYRDLMAIITEDNGNPASYADGADHITKTGESHNFAFRLADGTGVNVSDAIPLPPNYSVVRTSGAYNGDFDYKYYIGSGSTTDPANYSGYLPYVKGDLIYGRKPKWSIWADGLRWGMFAEGRRAMKADVNEIYENLYFLRFNFLKNFKGEALTELLKRWDGYNQVTHAPSAQVLSGLALDFHNHVACICDANSVMTGYNSSGRPVRDDYQCAFKYSLGSSALAKVNIGNLAPWEYTRAEQDAAELAMGYAWIVRGVSLDFVYHNQSNKYILASASAFGSETETVTEGGVQVTRVKQFSKDSVADKQAFREDGVTIENATFVSDLGEGLWNIFAIDKNGRLASTEQATLDTFVKLALLHCSSADDIIEQSKIHLDYLLPRVGEEQIVCNNDPVSYKVGGGDFHSRFLVGELNGIAEMTISNVKTKCDIEIWKAGASTYSSPSEAMDYNKLCMYRYNGNSGPETSMGYCIGATIALKPQNSNTLVELHDGDIICYMDYRVAGVRTQSNSDYNVSVGRYITFIDPEDLDLVDNEPHWTHPYNDGEPSQNWGLYDLDGYCWPAKILINDGWSGTYNLAHARAALFRWKDLLRSTSSDFNKWQYPLSYVRDWTFPKDNDQYAATAHLRVFEKANGPVAWDLDIRNQYPEYTDATGSGDPSTIANTFKIDYATGQQYVDFTKNSTDYRFYFLNGDRLIFKRGFAVETLIYCRFSAWYKDGTWKRFDKGGSGSVAYNIGAIKIYIDEIPVHNPHTEGRITTIAKFESVEPNHSGGYDVNGYHLELHGPEYNSDYVWLPNGSDNNDIATINNDERGSGLTGFYSLKVTISDQTKWHAGSIYVLRFGTSLDTYTNMKYDGTTN